MYSAGRLGNAFQYIPENQRVATAKKANIHECKNIIFADMPNYKLSMSDVTGQAMIPI